MKRAVILLSGVPGDRKNYEEAVRRAGGTAESAYLPQGGTAGRDGLILCGGGDMQPRLWGEGEEDTRDADPARDRAELGLVREFMAAGRPVLGICRGMQVINVALGGTLRQHLPPEQEARHAWRGGDRVHPVKTAAGSFLRVACGNVDWVNSAHHQAIGGRLGAGLRGVQWAEDGVIEGMEHGERPVFGVQWHPERLEGADWGRRLLRWFIKFCEK